MSGHPLHDRFKLTRSSSDFFVREGDSRLRLSPTGASILGSVGPDPANVGKPEQDAHGDKRRGRVDEASVAARAAPLRRRKNHGAQALFHMRGHGRVVAQRPNIPALARAVCAVAPAGCVVAARCQLPVGVRGPRND